MRDATTLGPNVSPVIINSVGFEPASFGRECFDTRRWGDKGVTCGREPRRVSVERVHE